jgi:hypothetical protein
LLSRILQINASLDEAEGEEEGQKGAEKYLNEL